MRYHPIEKTHSSEAPSSLAAYDTLLGQLQRGRGIGFVRALEEDPALIHGLLFKCITDDPRLDHFFESRSDYFARLVMSMNLSLDALNEYLHTEAHQPEG